MFEEKAVLNAINTYGQSPDHYYWKDTNHIFRMINESLAKELGHQSAKISFEGIKDEEHRCKVSELADEFKKQDEIVSSTLMPMSMLIVYFNVENNLKAVYCRKSPILDHAGELAGTSGYAIDAMTCPIMRSALSLILDDSFLDRKNHKLGQIIYDLKKSTDNFNLTVRESETLFFMIRGKTAKEIAIQLGISFKTVEKYQENLKLKLNCYTKSQVIEKGIAFGAGSVIPTSLFKIA